MASLDDIALLLGRTLESVEQLREDFNDEKNAARENRATIHRRLDEHATDIGKLRTDVGIMGQVDAQVRDEVKGLAETVEKNHKAVTPAVADWQRMKLMGLGIVGLVALGGLSVGAILAWANESAAAVIRHWLKIT